MRKLNIPDYDWVLVGELSKYARTTSALYPWSSSRTGVSVFKNSVTDLLLKEQSNRCAYCGFEFREKHPARDHIAPQGTYRQWMFRPENLVLACFFCNSEAKKQFDPIERQALFYRDSIFSFVHPYFDDPKDHIKFVGQGLKVLVSSAKSSAKGQKTIDLFELTSTGASKQRAKDVLGDWDEKSLKGKWRLLFQQVAFSLLTERLSMKLG